MYLFKFRVCVFVCLFVFGGFCLFFCCCYVGFLCGFFFLGVGREGRGRPLLIFSVFLCGCYSTVVLQTLGGE